MSEPNFKARNGNADSKLDDAKKHLEMALSDEAVAHETKMHVQTALRHVTEAQSYLRGG
jgi:hypothetical protein